MYSNANCWGSPPNNSMNLSVRSITAVACATAAPARPAGYAERYMAIVLAERVCLQVRVRVF
jgi:hypothetical protein